MGDVVATISDAFVELLGEYGLAPERAEGLAGELIRDYPLVRRRGVPAASARLAACGVAHQRAREVALVLLAFELLGRVPYERALACVSEAAGDLDGLAPCLRAARLRRRIAQQVPIREPRPIGARLLRAALGWLGGR